MGADSGPILNSRLSGALIGLLVGDALGVPYEFNPAAALPPLDQIEFDPPPGFRRSHAGVAPGSWSDDGAQALCLLASLLHEGRFEPRDFANRLINWLDYGYQAVDLKVFDVGNQTAGAIARLRAGVPPLEAGGRAEHSQGNGSLMRVLPLALWHKGSDAELVADAQDQSRLTHGHPTVLACCALYCLWARRILAGAADPWDEAVIALKAVYRDQPELLAALQGDVLAQAGRPPLGFGYVVDCLFSARHALAAGPFEAVVKTAVALGDDTDTTACVAGGLAGLRDGVEAIPDRWRLRLWGWETAEPLISGLVSWRGAKA